MQNKLTHDTNPYVEVIRAKEFERRANELLLKLEKIVHNKTEKQGRKKDDNGKDKSSKRKVRDYD